MKAKRVAIALLLTMLRNQNLSLLLIVSLLLVGCSEPIEKRYSNAITAGRADIRVVREFHTLFGPLVHDAILSFDGSVGPTTWSATSIIARRYRINLQIPVSISKDGRKVQANGDLEVLLVEITKVYREGSGVRSRFGKTQEHFGLSEWETLVKNGGDFEALGITLEMNKPVPNIELHEPYRSQKLEKPN